MRIPLQDQRFFWPSIVMLVVFLCLACAATGAEIIIVNLDDPGEGLNDPTPATPVGGNTGTTVGQQRINVLQQASEFWGARLVSSVPIRVQAQFDSLPCTEGEGILGLGGPVDVFRDFAGAPLPNTYYVSALANALAGTDLDPAEDDISAVFNSDVGSAECLPGQNWYYGLDHNAPENSIDFFNTVLHEFAHGLGFKSLVDLSTGAKFMNADDAFSRHLEDHRTGKPYPNMTDAERLSASTATGDLHWVGEDVLSVIDILSAGTSGGHVQMYAPNPAELGSSVSHWDTALSPDELMEPFANPTSDFQLTVELMKDIGWTLAPMVRVAICGAESDLNNADIKAKIVGSGLFPPSQVDVFSVANAIPTMAQLRRYNALLVYSNYRFIDPTAMGDVLAEYLERGGGVVVATHSYSSDGISGLAGRIVTAGYLPFNAGAPRYSRHLGLIKDLPSHALMDGISNFDGGLQSTRDSVALVNGATLVAHWSDDTPMIATTEPAGSKVVGLNFWPPSSDSDFYGWQSGSDGGRLMANALLWVAGEVRNSIPPCAGLTVINFDDVQAPEDFPETTRLTTRYEAQGVTFAGLGGLDGGAVLNVDAHFEVSGISGRNFLAFNTGGIMSHGGVPMGPETISFATPVGTVRMLAGSGLDPGHTLTVSAFDANSNLLSTSSTTLSAAMTAVQVTAEGIQRVVVSSDAPRFVLDDLAFGAACTPPMIVVQPTNQTVIAGGSASFDVKANGVVPLYYTWQLNGTNLVDGGNISGATTSHLVISNAQDVDAGSYSVTVSNALGTATSSAAILTVLPPGTAQIMAATVRRHSDGEFEFAISGAVGSNYEIYVSSDLRNWELLSAFSMTNSPSYCLDNVTNLSARFYKVRLVSPPAKAP